MNLNDVAVPSGLALASSLRRLIGQEHKNGGFRPPLQNRVYVRWTPHPVIVTIMDNKDYIRVLFYSYYTTNTGWGVLLGFGVGSTKWGLPLDPKMGALGAWKMLC